MDEPDPAARPRRRSFTAEYKAAILHEYDALPMGSNERGALLRREGLYMSHVAEWRKARDAGARDGLAPKPKARRSAEQVELAALRRKAVRLETDGAPWEGVDGGRGDGGLRVALRDLHVAARQVAMSGDLELLAKATAIVTVARKDLHRLLAES